MNDPVHHGDAAPPLVVDLDGTLIHTDLLYESALRLAQSDVLSLLRWPGWLAQGKAVLKRRIAERTAIDVTVLPYDQRVLAYIQAQRAAGRRTVLATASDERYAQAVAEHLGCFDEVLGSDGSNNLSASGKARALTERFGDKGFDYAGNSRADLPVWAASRQAIVANASPALRAQAATRAPVAEEFPPAVGGGVGWGLSSLRTWARALRLHQWLKNLLIFVPLLGAHQLLQITLIAPALLAFLAFGLVASSIYLLNDMADLDSDRRHPRKRARPLASGQLGLLQALVAMALLLSAGLALAFAIGPRFAAWVGIYGLTTVVYTFWAKRKLLLDAITLAGLYTLRIVAGAAAVSLQLSFWLLAVSLFLFLSLAFVKRYIELRTVSERGQKMASGRSYMTSDLPLVQMFGVASGYAAVLVMALYLNSDNVARLYATPQLLWLTIPLLLYWISRTWLQAHRGQVDDDPLLYAVKDRVSLMCGGLFLLLMALATRSW
jgi:4-hydroxybenzoate polyprenyltransferase/phosphoserine phosphatase